MSRLTAEQIARGRELAQGLNLPWTTERRLIDGYLLIDDHNVEAEVRQQTHEHRTLYIVEAANTLPAALDEIERLRGEVAELKKTLGMYVNGRRNKPNGGRP